MPSSTIHALVRLQHIPVVADNDVLVIGNTAALKLMAMAIKAEEENRAEDAERYEARAIRELEGELAAFIGDGAGTTLNMEQGFGAGRVRGIV